MRVPFELRKTFVAVDEILAEQGRSSGPPLVKVAVAAVIRNPLANRFGDRGRMNARLGGLKPDEIKGDGLR